MRNLVFCFMIIVTCSVSHAYVYSDYDWYSYNGHQYALTINYDNWVGCEAEAFALGGHLVTINDDAERAWLLNPTLQLGDSWAWGGVWCGLKYVSGNKALSSSWEWISGEPLTFWNPAHDNFPYTNGIHMTFSGRYHIEPGTFNNNPAHDTDPGSYLRGIIEISEPATLCILAPNGGEIYPVGTTKTITWNSVGEIVNVQLDYSANNGIDWTTLGIVENTGSHQWQIPNLISDQCLIRISDADNPAIFDVSNSTFSIRKHEWYSYNGHRYALTFKQSNWLDAQAEAESVGGHLVVINNEEEWNWVLNTEANPFGTVYMPSCAGNASCNGIWIGMKYNSGDIHAKESWEWINGDPITFWYVAESFYGYDGIHMVMTGALREDSGQFTNGAHSDNDPACYLYGVIELPSPLTVLSPNGGEIYPVGTTKTITWERNGEITNVQLSYSTDNGSTWNVIKTVANTGSTTWTIPNTPSTECLIKILDAESSDIFDISDALFTIQPAYPVVTSPNGGEQLYTNTERTIYWNTVGAISTILIEYSTDNGLNWTPVEPANVGNIKSYKWKVPHAVSEQCLIRVSDTDNPSSFDVSNASFSIIASTPELIIPNDGENLLTGSVADIRWLTRGVIENITIDYSIDNGSSWQPVSPANSGNSGHYQWTVPHQISDQCLVRVSNVDHPEIFDISENTFQIVASLPSLVSPNGGEQLLSGKTIPIQWNTTGSISDILIEYSLDNGATWIAVTPPNTGNNGTYDWTIPYVMSKECLIRVSDASHPVVNDVSDAVFEISPLYLTIPNGREKMVVNSQFTIRWNSGEALSGNLINLKYSTNKGQDWIDIVSTENDGVYEWAVPEIESNQYLIQITDVNSPEIQDISENTFMVYQCHEQIASDLDGDCTVGLSDFAIMAEQWLYEGIILSRIYAFDEIPNWTTEGQWEFGQPLGLGGASYGNPDPNSGYTGQNVYGINLSGDYISAISGPYYLTTSVIDCTQYDNVKVSFMSWLNIDDSNYAKCSFQVSADGTEWITLWSNTPEPVTDNDWNKMEFDISEYADDNPILYLRWGYQIIDRAYPYSGWNVDDVELWGTL